MKTGRAAPEASTDKGSLSGDEIGAATPYEGSLVTTTRQGRRRLLGERGSERVICSDKIRDLTEEH